MSSTTIEATSATYTWLYPDGRKRRRPALSSVTGYRTSDDGGEEAIFSDDLDSLWVWEGDHDGEWVEDTAPGDDLRDLIEDAKWTQPPTKP